MRLFIAIDICEELVNKIIPVQNEIKGYPGVKTVEPENLHITLKFLGEVPRPNLDSIKNALSDVKFNKFEISLKGIGFFPTSSNPRVIWIGVSKGEEKITELAKIVDKKMKKFGFKSDEFKAHVTIARIKRLSGDLKSKIKELHEKFYDSDFGSMLVENFKLKESILKHTGPIYKDLATFELL